MKASAWVTWIHANLPFAGLALISLLYLTIDLYQQVSSLGALWGTLSFWMLWLVFGFLDLLAFDLLYTKSHAQIAAMTSAPFLATAAMQFVATIGVYSILQSLTVQFGGAKVIDVQELIARFRSKTLELAAANLTRKSRASSRKLAARLRDQYKNDFRALREDYSQIMTLMKMPLEQIVKDLAAYEKSEGPARDVFLSDLVMRMAIADPENSLGLLLRRRMSQDPATVGS